MLSNNYHIILFDGVCNLCNHWVQFIVKHDHKGKFKFVALQSSKAKTFLEENNLNGDFNSIIYISLQGKVYEHSTAVLNIFRHLDGGWKFLYVLILIPKFIRDFIYNWIAKRRYKIWGRRDQCMLPDINVKDRFWKE